MAMVSAKVVFLRPCPGVDAVVVIDNVTLGPAIGGVRMRSDIAAAEYRGAARVAAFAEIEEKIRDTTAELLERTRHGTLTPRAAAGQIAHERLAKARALRRTF